LDPVGRAQGLDPEVEIHPEDYPPADPSACAEVLPATPVAEIRISGTLLVPEEWHVTAPEVRTRAMGGMSVSTIAATLAPEFERVEGNVVRSWSALVTEPGRYRVEVVEPPFFVELDVHTLIAGVELRLPKPSQLTIRVVDGVTKSQIDGARVWCRTVARGVPMFRGTSVDPLDDSAGLFETRCVSGEIEISCSARALGYDTQRFTTRLPEGECAIVVALFTATRVVVHIVDADSLEPIHWRESRREIGYVIEGPGGLYRSEVMQVRADGTGQIRLAQADRHVLRISDPPRGYLPSFPQAIVPRLGEVTDVEFRLTKRQ
jgi:hypothetical protein